MLSASAWNIDWQDALADVITKPQELADLLQLDNKFILHVEQAAQLFPLRVPRQFVARMQKGNPLDPLLLQVLPQTAETLSVVGYQQDPLQEAAFNPLPGLLHKYNNRVLLTLTGACAIHCRYCFRRHFPYAENRPGKLGLQKIYDYLRTQPQVTEVILSGGDPLSVNDQYLATILQQLCTIKHLQRIRLHTRLPIVIPQRISKAFVALLQAVTLPIVIVLHSNHPQEWNDELRYFLRRLQTDNITLLNQSVLLRGINDDAKLLAELSEQLFRARVQPYYLHMHDKVSGTAHFDLPEAKALAIYQELSTLLPGYLLPKLAREEPGKMSKTLL